MTDDVTWPPKVQWASTVGYPSDSLASCYYVTQSDTAGLFWFSPRPKVVTTFLRASLVAYVSLEYWGTRQFTGLEQLLSKMLFKQFKLCLRLQVYILPANRVGLILRRAMVLYALQRFGDDGDVVSVSLVVRVRSSWLGWRSWHGTGRRYGVTEDCSHSVRRALTADDEYVQRDDLWQLRRHDV